MLVSSYDENLLVYEPSSQEMLEKYQKVGNLWRIIQKDEHIISSCIYDGVRIFDLNYNLQKNIKTESICYAICLMDTKLVWAPFYSNCIEWIDFDGSADILLQLS